MSRSHQQPLTFRVNVSVSTPIPPARCASATHYQCVAIAHASQPSCSPAHEQHQQTGSLRRFSFGLSAPIPARGTAQAAAHQQRLGNGWSSMAQASGSRFTDAFSISNVKRRRFSIFPPKPAPARVLEEPSAPTDVSTVTVTPRALCGRAVGLPAARRPESAPCAEREKSLTLCWWLGTCQQHVPTVTHIVGNLTVTAFSCQRGPLAAPARLRGIHSAPVDDGGRDRLTVECSIRSENVLEDEKSGFGALRLLFMALCLSQLAPTDVLAMEEHTQRQTRSSATSVPSVDPFAAASLQVSPRALAHAPTITDTHARRAASAASGSYSSSHAGGGQHRQSQHGSPSAESRHSAYHSYHSHGSDSAGSGYGYVAYTENPPATASPARSLYVQQVQQSQLASPISLVASTHSASFSPTPQLPALGGYVPAVYPGFSPINPSLHSHTSQQFQAASPTSRGHSSPLVLHTAYAEHMVSPPLSPSVHSYTSEHQHRPTPVSSTNSSVSVMHLPPASPVLGGSAAPAPAPPPAMYLPLRPASAPLPRAHPTSTMPLSGFRPISTDFPSVVVAPAPSATRPLATASEVVDLRNHSSPTRAPAAVGPVAVTLAPEQFTQLAQLVADQSRNLVREMLLHHPGPPTASPQPVVFPGERRESATQPSQQAQWAPQQHHVVIDPNQMPPLPGYSYNASGIQTPLPTEAPTAPPGTGHRSAVSAPSTQAQQQQPPASTPPIVAPLANRWLSPEGRYLTDQEARDLIPDFNKAPHGFLNLVDPSGGNSVIGLDYILHVLRSSTCLGTPQSRTKDKPDHFYQHVACGKFSGASPPLPRFLNDFINAVNNLSVKYDMVVNLLAECLEGDALATFQLWKQELTNSPMHTPIILARIPPNRVFVALWFQFWTFDRQQQYTAEVKQQLQLRPGESLGDFVMRHHQHCSILQLPDATKCQSLFHAVHRTFAVQPPAAGTPYEQYRQYLIGMTSFYPAGLTPQQNPSKPVAVSVNTAPSSTQEPAPQQDLSVNVIKTKPATPSTPTRLEEQFRELQSKIRTFEQALHDRSSSIKEPSPKRQDVPRPSAPRTPPNPQASCSFCHVDGHDVSECRSLLSAIRLGLVQKPSAEEFRDARDKAKAKGNPAPPVAAGNADNMPPPPARGPDSTRGRGRGRGNRGRP